jgi:hypothetical protein
MSAREGWKIFFFGLVCAGFAAGLWGLFGLRFASGDFYPPYSSLRSDPMGCRGLFDTLGRLDGVTPSRLYRPVGEIGPGAGTTLFLLGLDPGAKWMPLPRDKALKGFVATGGRLVVAFTPVDRPGENDEAEAEPSPGGCGEGAFRRGPSAIWDVELGRFPAPDDSGLAQRSNAEARGLPDVLPRRSALHFGSLGPGWREVYRYRDRPVVVDRAYGRGQVILVADGFPLSNEALALERSPGFLAWLVGENARVRFAETHLGVSRQPGVAALARRYRLHGLAAGLALLALLVVWKHGAAFLPLADRAPDSDAERGRMRPAEGMVRLMARHIPPGDLIAVCLDTHEQSCGSTRGDRNRLADARRILQRTEKSGRDPVDLYREISRALAGRNRS